MSTSDGIHSSSRRATPRSTLSGSRSRSGFHSWRILHPIRAHAIASQTERYARVDRRPTLGLRVDGKSALREFQSLLHVVDTKPSARFCRLAAKTNARIIDGEMNLIRRSIQLDIEPTTPIFRQNTGSTVLLTLQPSDHPVM